ncbi:hypothetical protein Sm713_71480 [Streptomyces sp. TS71-3]|nr:hypothetical protein Sm713_71480 [Streptomyces sp. TS71-3]
MPIDGLAGTVQYAMDLMGICAFALSGAYLAVRKDCDVFGTIVLAEAAGLGGGVFRDLVIGVTPAAFTDLGYFLTPLITALAVFFTAPLRHEETWYELFDAAALGLFSVTGTIKTLTHGFNLLAATTLGISSAVGGGVISSILVLEVPTLLLWNRDLYALPALAGAGTVAVLHHTDRLNTGTAVAAVLSAFGLRLLALRYGWRTPRSRVWRNPFAGMRQAPAPHPADAALSEDTVTVRRPDLDRHGTVHPHAEDTDSRDAAHPHQEGTIRLRREASFRTRKQPEQRRDG